MDQQEVEWLSIYELTDAQIYINPPTTGNTRYKPTKHISQEF